jgi:hypothetical protein
MRHWQWQSLVLSGLAHGALVLLPTPAPTRPAARSRRQAYLTSEFSIISQAASSERELPSAPKAKTVVASLRVLERARAPAPAPAPAQVNAAEPVQSAPEAAPEPPLLHASARSRPLDLTPGAAARSLFDAHAVPPAQVRASSDAELSAAEGPSGSAGVDRALAALADLELVPKADGSYLYRLNGLLAIISKDGDVSFRDRPVSNPSPVVAAPIEAPAAAVSSRGPNISAVAKLKLDLDFLGPHKAERRQFLERTRELREQLAIRTRERALGGLASTLEQIWSRPGSSFAERRRQTFEAWDSFDEDELGAAARTLVTRFIRKHCPEESGCAFEPAELSRLNQGRRARTLFAPYPALADAGP